MEKDVYLFKVKDYTTTLVGWMEEESGEKIFYVQRGDGTKYKYPEYRVEWYNKIATIKDDKQYTSIKKIGEIDLCGDQKLIKVLDGDDIIYVVCSNDKVDYAFMNPHPVSIGTTNSSADTSTEFKINFKAEGDK